MKSMLADIMTQVTATKTGVQDTQQVRSLACVRSEGGAGWKYLTSALFPTFGAHT